MGMVRSGLQLCFGLAVLLVLSVRAQLTWTPIYVGGESQIDLWTQSATGCPCSFNSSKTACACCVPSGGCSCGSAMPNRCTQCGLENYCANMCNVTLDSRQLFSKSDRGFGQIKSPQLEGPSLCTYRFVPDTGQRVELQVWRMISIGRHNGTACEGGWLQFEGGARICGRDSRLQQPIVLFSDKPEPILQLQINESTDRSQVYAFYSFASIASTSVGWPAKGGRRVNNTDCDWVYEETQCYKGCVLASPGYPGLYPPNSRCRFLITANSTVSINISFTAVLMPLNDSIIYKRLYKVLQPQENIVLRVIKCVTLTYAITPVEGLAQLRIFNTLNCNVPMIIDGNNFTVNGLDMWENVSITANGKKSLKYEVDFTNCQIYEHSSELISGSIEVMENQATSWAITKKGLNYKYLDSVDKSRSGNPLVRALIYINDDFTESEVTLNIKYKDKILHEIPISKSFNASAFKEVAHKIYDLYINDRLVLPNVPIKLGGVYTVTGYISNNTAIANIITVTKPNSLSIFWMIPQEITLSVSEIMVDVLMMEFAFSEAPTSMKALLQSCWLFASFLAIRLQLLLLVLIFSNESHCTSDYIAVYAGPTTNSALLKTLCGKQKGSVVHVGKDLLVEFRSGPEVIPFDYNGFVASLNFVEITTEAPTTTTIESTSKAPEMIRSPSSTNVYNGAGSSSSNGQLAQQQRNGNSNGHQHRGSKDSASSGCDVEVSGERLRMGSHSTRGRAASAALASSCKLTLLGRDYDTVHVSVPNYNLSMPSCKSQIEVFDGLLDEKSSTNAKPIGKICGPPEPSQHQKQVSVDYVEKKRYSSSSRNMTIVLSRASDDDFMDVSYYFHNERESGTQQPKTFCDVEYYGLSSPKTGTVVHPKASRFNTVSGNVKCKQHFIPAANQAVIITLNSTMNRTHNSHCTTLCGDQGCRCASEGPPLENIDHLLLISRPHGNTLACICGNNRDWLPVEFWSTTPVYIEWSRSSHTGLGLNLTAEYKFAEDTFCGNHEVEKLDGEIHAGYSSNFSFALNHYYQQKCTYIIDSPVNRELVIQIESSQTRPCTAWNLTVHEYNKTNANSEGPRLHTFCPRDIARNFTIAQEIRSVIVKLQALGRTAPQFVLRWRNNLNTTKSRNKNLLAPNVALAGGATSIKCFISNPLILLIITIMAT